MSSMVSFSLSVSTDELTSVPGTSLHTEEFLLNKSLRFKSIPVSTRVSVALAQGRAENAFLLTGASFGLASLLAGAAKGGGSFLLAEAGVFVPVVLRVDAVPLPLAEPRGHAPPLLTDPLH